MRAMVAALSAVALAGAAHTAPSAAFLPGPRRRLLPALAGIGDPGHVALTFDDGPLARSTPLFLDLLRARGVLATFFLLGEQVARAPDVARAIVADGHEVAVHGWNHRCLLLKSPHRTYAELRAARDIIEDTTGARPRWFRAPYGVFSTSSLLAARSLGITPVLWSAWGFDWTGRATGASVHRRVSRDLDGGGTILLHDSDIAAAPYAWRSTLDALPHLLDECARRGFVVGPLCDHSVEPRSRARRTRSSWSDKSDTNRASTLSRSGPVSSTLCIRRAASPASSSTGK
jgi:peptidoglycan/xylan/chitin deacetylase (PgdA/CDA1 family)